MSAGWVAASIRARAMARRRLGATAARRLAASPSLEAAGVALRGTAYAEVAAATTLAQAQRAVAGCVLWQVRVLAGWMPAGGTPLARAVAAGFERENLVGQLYRLQRNDSARPADYDLGALGTAWPRARSATTVPALLELVGSSRWGAVTVTSPQGAASELRDQLTASWLRRLYLTAPAARSAVVAAAVLLTARLVAEGQSPTPQAVARLDSVLGTGWHRSRDLDGLRRGLDSRAGRILEGITSGDDLWVAEVGLWTLLDDLGHRLLRQPISGPEQVLGALAVLAADAFRVGAALAAVGAGGRTEVVDGVA